MTTKKGSQNFYYFLTIFFFWYEIITFRKPLSYLLYAN